MSTALAEHPTLVAIADGTAVASGVCWNFTDGAFVEPEMTLGYQAIAWAQRWLRMGGNTLSLTWEQKRFIVWWYAMDEAGRFIYRNGCMQRLKGAGKDPLAAVLCAIELVGPCRFSGRYAAADAFDLGIAAGDPLATDQPDAWVQIAAVTITQTRTTMLIFSSLFSKEAIKEYGITIGKELVYALGGTRQIQAVTSNPRALEGARTTFCLMNETHQWLEANDGHAMREVIDRNTAKTGGRVLSMTNAYMPNENSVAQIVRESWEAAQTGVVFDTRFLYDTLEASPQVRLSPPEVDGTAPDEAATRAWLQRIVRAVAGDAIWLPVVDVVDRILDPANALSISRRFWLNQVVADEEAWADPGAIAEATDPMARAARALIGADPLRAGWLVDPSEPVVLFGDGSKGDDCTGLVVCRISDGYEFVGGVWRKPPGAEGEGWQVPRGQVDSRVDEIMERFNVRAFYFDPSHTTDDEAAQFWRPTVDDWHRRYRDRLDERFWAVKGGAAGAQSHSIMWDMTSPARTEQFVIAVEQFHADLHEQTEDERWAPTFHHDGHPMLVEHLRNAKAVAAKNGRTSIAKEHRSSQRKIDLAVCAVGARMLRRLLLNAPQEEQRAATKQAGMAWGW